MPESHMMDTNIMNLLHFCRTMISIYCFILYNSRSCLSYHITKSDIPENPIVDNVSFFWTECVTLAILEISGFLAL